MSEPTLLPRPFAKCGGEGKIYGKYDGFWAACAKCEAGGGGNYYETPEEAAEVWNDRTPTPPVWQPIETAPKDGTLVDLWLSSGDTKRITGCYWSESGLCWTDGDRYYLKGRVQPTHWMPLPEPPKP